jgi:hypothetical protein
MLLTPDSRVHRRVRPAAPGFDSASSPGAGVSRLFRAASRIGMTRAGSGDNPLPGNVVEQVARICARTHDRRGRINIRRRWELSRFPRSRVVFNGLECEKGPTLGGIRG